MNPAWITPARLRELSDIYRGHCKRFGIRSEEAQMSVARSLMSYVRAGVSRAADLKHLLEEEDRPPLVTGSERRTLGRAEDDETLQEQLDEGLDGSFPCSDPISVTSTAISGCPKPWR